LIANLIPSLKLTDFGIEKEEIALIIRTKRIKIKNNLFINCLSLLFLNTKNLFLFYS